MHPEELPIARHLEELPVAILKVAVLKAAGLVGGGWRNFTQEGTDFVCL